MPFEGEEKALFFSSESKFYGYRLMGKAAFVAMFLAWAKN